MGNIPPHMLDQIRQAQERAQVTDNEVQAGPSKRARMAFMQAAKASDHSQGPAETIDPSLAGLECCFCQESIVPTSKTDTRAAKVAHPCRHSYHVDCLCAHWYDSLTQEEESAKTSEDDSDSSRKCVSCHQVIEKLQEFVASQVPAVADGKPSAASDAATNLMESEDPSMKDILLDIRGKLWDSNHKVVSAALRMLVQIIHSDIESDAGSEDDDSDEDDEREDYSDLVLSVGLPVVLVYCISRHGAQHGDIPKMVLGVFEWLVSREQVACRILPRIDNALPRIVESMQQNTNDGSLQYTGMQVLAKIVTNETRLALNSAGIVVATFQAIQNNKENLLVQEAALLFLDIFTTDSDFAIKAVTGHDQTLRERHAQCLAGSLLCVSKNATNDPDAVLACGHLILRLAQADIDFRAAMHKVAGAPIKQVFVNFGANADIKQLFRDVLRCLVTKPTATAADNGAAASAENDSRKMPAKRTAAESDNGQEVAAAAPPGANEKAASADA